jgi:antitoxin FitA
MSMLQIDLPEDRLRELARLAAELNTSVENLVRISVEELLALPDEEFVSTAKHVLKKNEELYRRLA